jgi:hypothetical protein
MFCEPNNLIYIIKLFGTTVMEKGEEKNGEDPIS